MPDICNSLTGYDLLVPRDCAGNVEDSVVYNTAYEAALEKLVERGLLDDISPDRLTDLGHEMLKYADAKEDENRLFLLEALERTIAELNSKSDE